MADQIVSTDTLDDISRHSNEVIRLARFIAESSSRIVVEKISQLDKHSDPFDLMTALDADLNLTIKMAKALSKMVSVLDDEHNCPELKHNEQNFKALFGEHYDEESQTLNLFNLKINARNAIHKDKTQDIKAVIYNHLFPNIDEKYSFDNYKRHLSVLKTMEKSGAPAESSSFEEALSYTMRLKSIDKWRPFYKETMSINKRYHEIRHSFNERDRKVLDEDVYFSKSMLYSVIKTSTYITKEEISQISRKHKKEEDGVVSKIASLVSNIDCIRAVEIDQDVDVDKFHDLLIEIKEMGLDAPHAFELKARKLGNYRFSGVYAKQRDDGFQVVGQPGYSNEDMELIAISSESFPVLGHELAHFRDRVMDENREKVVSHFGAKIDKSVITEMAGTMVDYFLNDREIIARLGEIGLMLNKFNYTDGESVAEFAERARELEKNPVQHKDKIGYDVSIVNSVDFYMAEGNVFNSSIYFDFSNWKPDELSIIRDYTRDFFYKHDPDIAKELKAKIESGCLKSITLDALKNKRKTTRRERSESQKIRILFGKMDADDLVDIYKTGNKKGYFKPGEFLKQIGLNSTCLGDKGKSSIAPLDWIRQTQAYLKLAKDIAETPDNQVEKLLFAELVYTYGINNKIIIEDKPDDYKREVIYTEMLSTVMMKQAQRLGTEAIGAEGFYHGVAKGSYNCKQKSSTYFKNVGDPIKEAIAALPYSPKDWNNVSSDEILGADDVARFKWVAANFMEVFSSPDKNIANEKLEKVMDLIKSVNLTSYLVGLNEDEFMKEINSFRTSGLSDVISPRDDMGWFAEVELNAARELVDSGFFSGFDFNRDFVKDNAPYLGVDLSDVELSSDDPKLVMHAFFDQLENHKSRDNVNKKGVLSPHRAMGSEVINKPPEPGEKYPRSKREVAVTPIGALAFLASKSSPQRWQEETKASLKENLKEKLLPSFSNLAMEKEDVLRRGLSSLVPRFSSGLRLSVQQEALPVTSLFFSEVLGDGLKLSNEYKKNMLETIISEIIEIGEKGKKGVYLRNQNANSFICEMESIESNTEQSVYNYMKHCVDKIAKYQPKNLNIKELSFYSEFQSHEKELIGNVNDFFQRTKLGGKDIATSMIQASILMAQRSPIALMSEQLDAVYKEALSETFAACRAVALPMSTKQSLYVDISDTLEAEFSPEVGPKPSPEIVPEPSPEMKVEPGPEIKAEPKTEPVSIDEAVDFEEINKDVPEAGKGSVLKPINQLKMF